MKNNSIIVKNRKASFSYFLEEYYEAGIVLKSSEVKSIRQGNTSITDSYAVFENGELYVIGMHVGLYKQASFYNHEPKRKKKLLLRKKELKKIYGKAHLKGYSLVPCKLYSSRKNLIKITIAIAKGKKLHDKRQTLKEKEWKRRQQKEL